ncbi:hypothetical protein J6590_046723 [Homalodisca vitripennis]|nr:hypothetical protein J6590_046723 [Homalodisca vitripennis]
MGKEIVDQCKQRWRKLDDNMTQFAPMLGRRQVKHWLTVVIMLLNFLRPFGQFWPQHHVGPASFAKPTT